MKAFFNNLLSLARKYAQQLKYLIFGALTTLINQACYYLCYDIMGMANLPSVAIAWVVSVLFAFITNKLWVFESKSFDKRLLLREMASFFACRILTGLLDMGIMYLTVDILNMNHTLWKLLSNVIVIILNYFGSRFLVFVKKK